MALVFISKENVPAYIALSTDIVAGKLDGAVHIGKTVFTTDDGAWYLITDGDGTLVSYTQPPLAV